MLVGMFILLNTYAYWRIKGEQSESNYVVGACLNFEFIELKDQEDKKIGGFTLEGAKEQATGTCIDVNGAIENCDVDFSIIFSSKVASAKNDITDEDKLKLVSSLTYDDAYVLIYGDLSNIKQSSLDAAIKKAFTIVGVNYEMFALAGMNINNIKKYKVGTDTITKDGAGVQEIFFAISNINGAIDALGLNYRMSYKVNERLVINSLDLSKATYLEKIEGRAFSNVPYILDEHGDYRDRNNADEALDIETIPVGLTSLTFGDHPNGIRVGGAAFAKMNLDNLTIPNSITFLTDDDLTGLYPNDLNTIGDLAFALTKNVNEGINFPSTLNTIKDMAFASLNINSLYIPHSVTTISSKAFSEFAGTVIVDNSAGNVNFAQDWIKEGTTVNYTNN